MARKRNTRTWIGAILFVLIVTQIGLVLQANGHMRNPFQVFAQINQIHLDFRDYRPQERRPEQQAAVPGVKLVDSGLGEVRWSQFGNVLFDWWFMAAITALVIVIGRPIGVVIKRLRGAVRQPLRSATITASDQPE